MGPDARSSRIAVILWCGIGAIAFSLMTNAPSLGQPNEVARFRNALIDYFLPLNYVPVLVNRGYSVGDVIDVDGVDLFARSVQCFPSLKPPPPSASSLDDALQTDAADLSFGLKLRQIFDSSAGADLQRRFRIMFSDVTVVAVTRMDLKNALDRSACPEIAALVDASVTPLDRNKKPYFVVSEIIYGKREAVLEFGDQANLQAKADRLGREIADASVRLAVSNEGFVTVKSDVVLPIALKPVTVPKVITVADLSQTRGEEQEQLKWDPLDCLPNHTCPQLFAQFADLMKVSRPRLSQEDLDK
jgi:hypothetical protein